MSWLLGALAVDAASFAVPHLDLDRRCKASR
jgi:hypothetical protein